MLLPLLLASLLGSVDVPTTVDVSGGFVVPEPAGTEKRLVEDARDGVLDSVDPVTGVLLASGVAEGQLESERLRLEKALRPVVDAGKREKDPNRRGGVLLRALHQHLFHRYDADVSRIPQVMDTGSFNCISSAVLYVLAAQGLMEQPSGMMSATHAFARVRVGGKPVDVETTVPEGFAPDRLRLFTPELVKRLGLRTAGSGPVDVQAEAKKAQEVQILGLMAGLYSNRAVEHIQRGEHLAAATALDRATRLAQGPIKARMAGWRAALLGNAAKDLLLAKRPADAIPLLKLGLDGAEGQTRATLMHNLAVAHQDLGLQARDRGELGEALRQMDEAVRLEPDSRELQALRMEAKAAMAKSAADAHVCEGQGTNLASCLAEVSFALLQRDDVEGALRTAESAMAADGKVVNARLAFWNALQKRASGLAAKRACREAERDWIRAETVRDVIRKETRPMIEKSLACLRNAAIDVSEENNPVDAMRLLRQALEKSPSDATTLKAGYLISYNEAVRQGNQGRCDEARSWVMEVRTLAPEHEAEARQLLAACAMRRLRPVWDKQDWIQAEKEARQGLRDAPGNQSLREALSGALYNQASALWKSETCSARVRALLAESREVGAGTTQPAPPDPCER